MGPDDSGRDTETDDWVQHAVLRRSNDLNGKQLRASMHQDPRHGGEEDDADVSSEDELSEALHENVVAHFNMTGHQIFADITQMKERVRIALIKKTYNVADYYKEEGCWQAVARSSWFEQITLLVITLNAGWIWVDTDLNKADLLLEADTLFQVMDIGFCLFFMVELTIRFMAFKWKRNCFRDAWFVFDSFLVMMAVLEVWVLNLVMLITGGRTGLGGTSMLRLLRLLRLSRMARMARLLRMIPELMILIKGMAAASRSVCLTLCLMAVMVYIYALCFTQLTSNSEAASLYFFSVTKSMESLILFGIFYDNTGELWAALLEENVYLVFLFFLFIVSTTWTVMNMLIGVLCEVVAAVASSETEEMTCLFVKGRLQQILKETGIDQANNGQISKKEFKQILENADACRVLAEVGVDPVGLVDFTDFFFEDDSDANTDEVHSRQLSFTDFMTIILQLRGSNSSTVKDIVDLRKFIRNTSQRMTSRLARLEHLVLREQRHTLQHSSSGVGGRRLSGAGCKPRSRPISAMSSMSGALQEQRPRSLAALEDGPAAGSQACGVAVAAKPEEERGDRPSRPAHINHAEGEPPPTPTGPGPGPAGTFSEGPRSAAAPQPHELRAVQQPHSAPHAVTSPSKPSSLGVYQDGLRDWVLRCENDFAARQTELASLLSSEVVDTMPLQPALRAASATDCAALDGPFFEIADGSPAVANRSRPPSGESAPPSSRATALFHHGPAGGGDADAASLSPPRPPPPPPARTKSPPEAPSVGSDASWLLAVQQLKARGRAVRLLDVLSVGRRELHNLREALPSPGQ